MKLSAALAGSGADPCCCGPVCCMYPAYPRDDESIDYLYPFGDLPAEIKVDGEVWAKVGSEWPVYTSDPIYTGASGSAIMYGGSWVFGDFGSSICLVGGYTGEYPYSDGVVEDVFTATYTIDWAGQTVTVTRESLCVWSYTSETIIESQICYARLFYDPTTYGWVVAISVGFVSMPSMELYCGEYVGGPKDTPDGSTPTGEYMSAYIIVS